MPLRLDSPHGQAVSKNPGFVQLFHLPHPRRQAGVGGRLPETAPQQPDEGGGGGLQGSVESCHAGLTELETAHAFAHDCVLEPCYALPLPAPAPAGKGGKAGRHVGSANTTKQGVASPPRPKTWHSKCMG